MTGILFRRPTGVIPACDVVSLEAFKRLLEETSAIEGIVGYKLGCILTLAYGLPALVATAKEITDLPLIYDHQKAGTDIPDVAKEFAEICASAGISAAIIFPQAGPETGAAFVKALLERNLVPIVGGEMTHPKYLAKEGGFIRDEAPIEMYEVGAELGVTHFVIPGNRPESIERYSRTLSRIVDAPKFLMPGMGRQGGDVRTAFRAAGPNSCYAIVGSAIYRASNTSEAARRLCEEALGFG